MKITKRIRDLHETERPNYIRLSDDVCSRLQGLCDDRGWFLKHRVKELESFALKLETCLLYTSPSPRDRTRSRMPSSA